MRTETRMLPCQDGQRIQTITYLPESPEIASVLIAPALGITQQFYRHIAHFLAEAGYRVLTLDYRGVGGSPLTTPKASRVGLLDWANQDLAAALAELVAHSSDRPLYWLGHSFGGQALALVPGHERVDGVVTVASSVPYWRHYGRRALGMWAFWHLLAPALSLGNAFPARKVGIARRDLPSGLIRQWARWGRRRDYLFCPSHQLDLSAYGQFSKPMRHYGFADDHYAPPLAVRDLASRFPAAPAEVRILEGGELTALGGVGHFSYFEARREDTLWAELKEYFAGLSEPENAAAP
ncbi:alpha/beta fold hydrolase [Marinobacter hydrocarbonoclasticus]|nr:alpha/beta fold hydrolase [Marinobacter nauticus]